MSDRDYAKDLYALLNVGRHVSPGELRHTYEQAVGAATRSGDMVRARILVSAYEALSKPRRDTVFGRTYDGIPTFQPPSPAVRRAKPPRQRREPRPRKWGMSLPIRLLLYFVITPLFVVATVESWLDPQHWTSSTSVGLQQNVVNRPSSALPNATAAALYVERINGRADVTCNVTGSDGTEANFTCRASDGQTWQVTATSPYDFRAVTTAPSVFLSSARLDAHVLAGAIDECIKLSGALPGLLEVQGQKATFGCGASVGTVYLRPGDTFQYTSVGRVAYTVTVVAGNGEEVVYDSRTRAYR